MKPKNIMKHVPNPEQDRDFDERLASFDEPFRNTILTLEQNARNNSDPERPAGMLVGQFFGGAGGTGKTSLVKLLAARLGVPLLNITLPMSKDLNELRGSQNSSLLVVNETNKNMDKLVGSLAAKIVGCGVSNPVVFIDEASVLNDPTITEYMKVLLQERDSKLKVESLGISVDLSRVTFIFAANASIADKALLQRLPELTFPALTKAQKLQAAKGAIDTEMVRVKEQMDAKTADKIMGIIVQSQDRIAEKDMQHNSGGRVIQLVIRDFIVSIAAKLKANPEISLSDEDIEQEIANIYLARPPESTSDQRIDYDKQESVLNYISSLIGHFINTQDKKATLEALAREVKQFKIVNNDAALKILYKALMNDKTNTKKPKIIDSADQATALYMIGLLAKACKQEAAANPRATNFALGGTISALVDALEANLILPANKELFLTTLHDVINMLPSSKGPRKDAIKKLRSLATKYKADKDVDVDVYNQIMKIANPNALSQPKR